jgi:hypothetical protein
VIINGDFERDGRTHQCTRYNCRSAYRTSSPVTVRPISIRWISLVPSKMVKIAAVALAPEPATPRAGRIADRTRARHADVHRLLAEGRSQAQASREHQDAQETDVRTSRTRPTPQARPARRLAQPRTHHGKCARAITY